MDYSLPIAGVGFGPRRKGNHIQYVIVHHSATPVKGRDYPALWWASAFHRYTQRRYNAPCPYHLIIAPDGSVARGRYEKTPGRHASGFNRKSLGICLVGNFDIETPTKEQIASLQVLILDIMAGFGIVADSILGHFEANIITFGEPRKTCPGKNLNMSKLRQDIVTTQIMQREGMV